MDKYKASKRFTRKLPASNVRSWTNLIHYSLQHYLVSYRNKTSHEARKNNKSLDTCIPNLYFITNKQIASNTTMNQLFHIPFINTVSKTHTNNQAPALAIEYPAPATGSSFHVSTFTKATQILMHWIREVFEKEERLCKKQIEMGSERKT